MTASRHRILNIMRAGQVVRSSGAITNCSKRPSNTYFHRQNARNISTTGQKGNTYSANDYERVSPEKLGGSGRVAGNSGTMRTWQIHNYGGPSELQLSTSVRIPLLTGPEEVLVKVHAASVNPLDLAMTNGKIQFCQY